MAADDVRARYLSDRVLTATPAQRVVMLYDRLGLDLALAQGAADAEPHVAADHLRHALEVVAELHSSLDVSAGGPAENLSSIYAYLLRELLAARGGESERLPAIAEIVTTLRAAWNAAAEQLTNTAPDVEAPTAAGAWVA
jgi:flagellar secretion chaperone FliS